jgi:hypothetical protein
LAQYFSAVPDDPVARLQKRLNTGQARLEWYDRHGYLRAVLRELNVSPASQMLVFSKTSFQRDRISPRTPRALYYNDQVYVGWVQNGDVLEISAVDAKQGTVFYTLRQEKTSKPRFVRQTYDCLQCHQSSVTTGDVPGLVVRSVFAGADGNPELRAGTFVTSDDSPFEERWGGWYVTGTHGRQRHMGNVVARGAGEDGEVTLDRDAGANVFDLAKFLDTAPYLTRHSDIVALLVLEHQTTVHNLLTKANYLTRDALRDERRMNAFENKNPDERRPATQSRVQNAVEPLVRALLFSGAAPLTDSVAGTSPFAKKFAAIPGPRDKQGRSLRDLDLKTRLLRYPLSFLIYSDAFDALPGPAKDHVYQRLRDILGGKDTSKEFAHLSDVDRRAIFEILRDTKADFTEITPTKTRTTEKEHGTHE